MEEVCLKMDWDYIFNPQSKIKVTFWEKGILTLNLCFCWIMEENSEVHLNLISLYPYLCFFSLSAVKNIQKMKLLFKEKKKQKKKFIQLLLY